MTGLSAVKNSHKLGPAHRGLVAPPRPGRLVAGCCIAAAAIYVEPSLWVFYPPKAEPFGTGWAQASLLSGLWSVILVLFLVIGGLLGDKYGRRRMLLIGLLGSTLANALLLIEASNAGHIALLAIGMLASLYVVSRYWGGGQIRRMLAIGLAMGSLSIGLMAIRPETMPFFMQVLPMAIFGFALLAVKTVWADAFFQTVIDDYIGLNAGINSATIQIGGALGSMLGGQLVVLYGYRAFQERWSTVFTQERINSLYTATTQAASRQEALQKPDLSTYGTLIWDEYVVAYADGYSQTLIVLAGICLITAALVYYGFRRNMRFSAQEVEVDTDASVFEEVVA